MKIRSLFTKPIDRPINGVIKADQRDAESIWQELDEYVVTRQLTEYFRRFFDAFLAAADNPKDPVVSSRMGVWVSGFFGSGKSHFIKILSYLLENIEAVDPVTGNIKRAAAFFDERKIKDALLLADMQRAAKGSSDVILFNIDAKADSKSDRDVILQVFLRVFNEKQGYSGDAPHIAEMERYLAGKGAYDAFKAAFQEKNGSSWAQERDAVDFLRDEVVYALSKALGMTEESAGRWFDNSRDDYKINIEGLAKVIRDYLDIKPAAHRIIFLVDEVGQFIGDNTQLMLTLQTITEQLGTLCQGRAWVIVTSQEDIDAAIGETNKAKSQDFSKIQGRFHTRLSLASSNTDDVISERLLSKTEDAHVELRDCFEKKGDIINNQLAFVGNSVSMRSYKDAAEFVACYPFAPYQFTLLQKIFESIRKVGATGKHLSKGERSLLDAFQSAAVRNAEKGTDTLIPVFDFYPSIESFIDTSAKRSIDEAPSNPLLETYDVQLLKALFLIRYIPDIIKPNVDNLATLCVDQIDADKLVLKRKIQESLTRLENQRLVSRNGDLWSFLTNEERDVAREIGHVEVSALEKSRLLSELVFEEILSGTTKVRHRETKGDYEINRLLDGAPWKIASHALSLEIVTPLSDDYESLNDAKAILRSSDRAMIRMSDSPRLDIELTLYLQIEKYIDSPKASSAPVSLKRILSDRKDENRERRTRLVTQLGNAIVTGDSYALGQKMPAKAGATSSQVDDLVNYLISNTYNKLTYLKVRQPDPIAEIKAVLMADSIGQHSIALGGEEGNPLALNEMREYLRFKASQSRVLLSDVVDRFSGVPWGWKPEWEIVLLIARMYMAGEIKLISDNSDLEPSAAIESLTKAVRFKQVSILNRKTADAAQIKRARDLHKDLFSKIGREDEDSLVADFRENLALWQGKLKEYSYLANTRHHPGKAVIDQTLTRITKQLAVRDSFEFVEALLSAKDEWLDVGDDIHDLVSFYTSQLQIWRQMLESLQRFEPNLPALSKEVVAAHALKQLEAIRDNPTPYSQVSQIGALIQAVDGINTALVHSKREHALLLMEKKIAEVGHELDQAHAPADLRNRALRQLQQYKLDIAEQTSIPQIHYLQEQSGTALDNAMDMIAVAVKEAEKKPSVPPMAVKSPGDHATVFVTNTPPASTTIAPKPPKAIRAADLCSKSYLETEAEVEEYLEKLKTELLAAIKSGQRARIQ
ncbi:MAG: BREX system P-loop protein BrxC [Gallionella sp.]|nr:BREX system P-loop protein BrxC [Gallionella sp.]MDD4946834.1 BREX system P-loop protein BrxC [Gallionella sp.]